MRIQVGTTVVQAAAALALVLALAAGITVPLLLAVPGAAEALRTVPNNAWWFVYTQAPASGPLGALWRVGGAAAATFIGAAAALRAFALYRRGTSPLLPFLILFFLSQSLECLRAATAYLYVSDRSISLSIILTRMIYWGRFVGLLGLLLAALYRIELKYRRYGILTALVLLVGFAMAAYIPVDRTVFLQQLTWKLGDEQGVWFLNLAIGILTVVTSAGATFIKRDLRYLKFAGGLFLLIASREMLFFGVSVVLLGVGLVVLAAGTVACLGTLSAIFRQESEKSGA
jgi:hypothetical protein